MCKKPKCDEKLSLFCHVLNRGHYMYTEDVDTINDYEACMRIKGIKH